MKRTAMILIALFLATSLFAGDGKSCDAKHAAKAVQLTGTILTTGDGDAAKTVFRTSDGSSYTVCGEGTKASILKLGKDGGANVKVKGKVVNCSGGEELVIESAQKI